MSSNNITSELVQIFSSWASAGYWITLILIYVSTFSFFKEIKYNRIRSLQIINFYLAINGIVGIFVWTIYIMTIDEGTWYDNIQFYLSIMKNDIASLIWGVIYNFLIMQLFWIKKFRKSFKYSFIIFFIPVLVSLLTYWVRQTDNNDILYLNYVIFWYRIDFSLDSMLIFWFIIIILYQINLRNNRNEVALIDIVK